MIVPIPSSYFDHGLKLVAVGLMLLVIWLA